MIQFPRLLDDNMAEVKRLLPISLTVDLNMKSLSTATLTVQETESIVSGQYIELYARPGSLGIFRVQQAEQEAGNVMRLSLEHGIISMADDIIPLVVDNVQASAPDVLAIIMENQSMWVLGTVDLSADDLVTWSCDYSNVYESLVNLMENFPDRMMTFDQSQTPWRLNIVRVSDENASECRLSRNMKSLVVETDRTELCTRIYIPNGNNAPVILDADTQSVWKIVSRRVSADDDLTLEEKTKVAEKYLEEHKNPKITVSIDAIDLSSATGESIDAFYLGRMCRVCLPDYGQTINQRVVVLTYPDVYGDPDHVLVTLADNAITASRELAGLVIDTTVIRKYVDKGPKGTWRRDYFLMSQPTVNKYPKYLTFTDASGTEHSIRYLEDISVDVIGRFVDYVGKPTETE